LSLIFGVLFDTFVTVVCKSQHEGLMASVDKVVSSTREFKLGMFFSSKTESQFYFFGNRFSNLILLSFSCSKLHNSCQMLDKINSHICLMLSVYKSFHQTVKYG